MSTNQNIGSGVAGKLEAVFQAQGQQVLGALVYWSLAGVHWEREAMRAEWNALGLGRAIGRDPRPEALLTDAVYAARAGAKDVIFRRLSRYEWALVEESRTAGDVLAHVHAVTLRVVPATTPGVADRFESEDVAGATASTAERHASTLALAAKVERGFADAKEFAGTSDLSNGLTTALHGTTRDALLAGISLREGTGGLYFVPAAQVDRARALAALVNRSTASSVYVLALYADEANLETAAKAAKASFTAQLNALRSELREFVQERKDAGEEIKESHLETRVRRLQSLQDRVGLWTEVLGGVAAELTGSIEAAKAEVAQEIGVV
jgi:hypothetical protein